MDGQMMENYSRFVCAVVRTGEVFSLVVDEQLIVLESINSGFNFLGSIPFWSDKSHAEYHISNNFKNAQLTSISLAEFMYDTLPQMQREGMMVHPNWDPAFDALEDTPISLASEISKQFICHIPTWESHPNFQKEKELTYNVFSSLRQGGPLSAQAVNNYSRFIHTVLDTGEVFAITTDEDFLLLKNSMNRVSGSLGIFPFWSDRNDAEHYMVSNNLPNSQLTLISLGSFIHDLLPEMQQQGIMANPNWDPGFKTIDDTPASLAKEILELLPEKIETWESHAAFQEEESDHDENSGLLELEYEKVKTIDEIPALSSLVSAIKKPWKLYKILNSKK